MTVCNLTGLSPGDTSTETCDVTLENFLSLQSILTNLSVLEIN